MDIGKQLNDDFSDLHDWFVRNKLSDYFGMDKTKSVLFTLKRKMKKILTFDNNNIQIKQFC